MCCYAIETSNEFGNYHWKLFLENQIFSKFSRNESLFYCTFPWNSFTVKRGQSSRRHRHRAHWLYNTSSQQKRRVAACQAFHFVRLTVQHTTDFCTTMSYLYLWLLCLLANPDYGQTKSITGDSKASAFNYLMHHGYIDAPRNEDTAQLLTEESLTRAIKDFQVGVSAAKKMALKENLIEILPGLCRTSCDWRVGRRNHRFDEHSEVWRRGQNRPG